MIRAPKKTVQGRFTTVLYCSLVVMVTNARHDGKMTVLYCSQVVMVTNIRHDGSRR